MFSFSFSLIVWQLVTIHPILVSYYLLVQADIDLQTCIDNFEVHRDKIIRTTDSQNMGAKYLNEIDLGNRQECLRLCCETVDCDVFVFEEKESGSCYLFHCGGPDFFMCKFTHHANYSSAVLTVSRNTPDLESQIKHTKHTNVFQKFRPENSVKNAIPDSPKRNLDTTTSTTTTTTSTTTTPKSVELLPENMLRNQKNTPTGRRQICSHYQFECRSGDECIAIYDVCNGIPQCTDGSDEIPKFGCPPIAETTTKRLNLLPPNIVSPPQTPPLQFGPVRQNNIMMVPASRLIPSEGGALYPASPAVPFSIQSAPPKIALQSQQMYDNQRNIPNDLRLAHVGAWNEGEIPIPGPQYGQNRNTAPSYEDRLNAYGPANEVNPKLYNYNPRDDVHYVQNNPVANTLNSNGVSQPYINYDPRPPDHYYEDTFRPSPKLSQRPNTWPVNTYDSNSPDTGYNSDKSSLNSNRQKLPEIKVVLHPDSHTPSAKAPPHHEQQQQQQMVHELKENAAKVHNLNAIQYADMIAINLSNTRDGPAETPSGAALSLAIGLFIVCVMGLLIGCRLRLRKRIIRKGTKAGAHDADFLVNGMYL